LLDQIAVGAPSAPRREDHDAALLLRSALG
jgi:hypothetical protein